MQSLGTFISENPGLAITLAVLAALVITAILIFLYRLAFGRRLHMTGSRSRQPRLGVVDAFDLDRQRQLVLVRRDNVEHLLMIGGPNDLVIESAFQRVQPSVAVPLGRDKEGSLAGAPVVPMPLSGSAAEAAAAPAEARSPAAVAAVRVGEKERASPPPLDLVDPVSPKDLGVLSDIPAPGPVGAPPPATPATPEAPPPDPAPPRAFPARPPLPARLGAGGLPPRPPLTSLRTSSAAGTQPVQRPSSLLPNRPTPVAPLQRGTSAASLRRDPPGAAPGGEGAGKAGGPRGEIAPPAPADAPPAVPDVAPAVEKAPGAETAPPAPGSLTVPPKPVPALPLTLDSIESLEEEMAKLLGRAGTDKT